VYAATVPAAVIVAVVRGVETSGTQLLGVGDS